ncbi:ABC transporter ATP-binding protein [Undibacterium sp. TS12]|uniref:ABC transporter ATP-binding protein n=1 Tax=Undibacterium sp. TS12 TaxID=2908202 RepID=UPI001F4C551C|nr:ABC transporter ATP-binding protein [Undibacterium sp. TS12]MCH8618885.1 ABC transporter ATP-binding protein [Undibacterium sp. TS12]
MSVLQLHGLVKRYGGLLATNELSLEIEEGEIHAIIGPNGAGKTTLIHQISGAVVPNQGKIIFNDRDVTILSMHERAKLGLCRSYQITNIFQSYTVIDNLSLALQASKTSSMRFWRPAIQEKTLFAEARQLAKEIGLEHQAQTLACALAHGEQRQLELGLALACKPQLLLLDEPMAGTGHEESAKMIELIQALRGKASVILIEHDMDAVFKLADRISVLVAGRIIATGTADFIRQHPEVKKAYLGDEMSDAKEAA